MQLEAGKKYTDRRGRVYGPIVKVHDYLFGESAEDCGWHSNGSRSAGKNTEGDLVAEYVEPTVPVESPDDWVELTDLNHVLRETDELTSLPNMRDFDSVNHCADRGGWVSCLSLRRTGQTVGRNRWARARCRRKDLPPVKPVVDPGEGYRLLGDDEITLPTDERAYSCSMEWLPLPSANPSMVGRTPAELRNTHGSDIVVRRRKTRTVVLKEWICWDDGEPEAVTVDWFSLDPSEEYGQFLAYDHAHPTGNTRTVEIPVT